MEQPSEERHLRDLGSTEGMDPTSAESVQDAPASAGEVVSVTEPAPGTLTGSLGLEDSPADTPTSDDRFGGAPA